MSNKRQIEDVLKEDGLFVSTTVGTSMYPMLRNRKDTIIITPYEGRLKKYDVPLYKRGSNYILHRIVRVCPESYVICGDNCVKKEYGITDQQILGVLTGFYRGSRKINIDGFGYKLYSRVWCMLYPIRRVYMSIRRIMASIWHKIRKERTE